jgi:general secretion pathway protein B
MDPAPEDSGPVYAPEIPASRIASSPPHHASRLPDPVLNEADDKSDSEVLPSISELNLTGQQALPDLHLDVHVFASQPAERFVYINMRKYREVATLAEGPVLERIRRDGVVLSYNGLRFVLPRQQ